MESLATKTLEIPIIRKNFKFTPLPLLKIHTNRHMRRLEYFLLLFSL